MEQDSKRRGGPRILILPVSDPCVFCCQCFSHTHPTFSLAKLLLSNNIFPWDGAVAIPGHLITTSLVTKSWTVASRPAVDSFSNGLRWPFRDCLVSQPSISSSSWMPSRNPRLGHAVWNAVTFIPEAGVRVIIPSIAG